MVGASNELPESEELDALYDRFLIRKEVKQVSPAGLTTMLTFYSSSEASSTAVAGGGSSMRDVQDGMMVTRDDITTCKQDAVRSVRVPASVIQMVTDLRTYLQEKIEPPVYVSDRRLVKSVQLLQVAAHCNGRDSVSEYDVLLLQHVLWARPDTSDKIADWVLSQLSADDGTKQVSYLLSGLFSRACRSLGNPDKLAEITAEAASLRELLVQRYSSVALTLEGGFPAVLDNLWLGEEEAQAVATALQPKLAKTRGSIDAILSDVATLEVALRNGSDPVTLANLMPRHWADFIR
jgi:MoxR-like ATPase